jgi:ketosteroid isomerase-like protein
MCRPRAGAAVRESAAMSQDSYVEVARRGFAAVARGDFDAVREILDPEVRWHGSEGPGVGSCVNRDEVIHFMREAVRRRGLGRLVDVIDAGDQVIVVMQPAAAGDEQPAPRANLTTFRDGRVVRMVAYETPEAALAATRR